MFWSGSQFSRPAGKRRVDGPGRFLGRDRFRQVAVHSRLQALLPIADHGVSCHGDNGNVGAAGFLVRANDRCSFESVHLRHLYVHEHQIKGIVFDRSHGFFAVFNNHCTMSQVLQQLNCEMLVDVVVLCNQNAQCVMAIRVCRRMGILHWDQLLGQPAKLFPTSWYLVLKISNEMKSAALPISALSPDSADHAPYAVVNPIFEGEIRCTEGLRYLNCLIFQAPSRFNASHVLGAIPPFKKLFGCPIKGNAGRRIDRTDLNSKGNRAMTTILLVEDNRILQLASQRILSRAGYRVLIAEDGEKAVAMAHTEMPDIILLDMMLPKLSGPEVLNSLKQDPSTAHIPVIVLTGLSKKNEDKLRKVGSAAFIEKSQSADNPNLLLLTIEKVLNHAKIATEVFDGIPLEVNKPAAVVHQ